MNIGPKNTRPVNESPIASFYRTQNRAIFLSEIPLATAMLSDIGPILRSDMEAERSQ